MGTCGLLTSGLVSPLRPTNVVNSWLRKCPLSLFESRNPRTFSPFNNDILINDIHIPLYSTPNINGYRFFRRINSIPTSGHRKLISDQKHLRQNDTNNTARTVTGGQRAVVARLWRWHTRAADLQTSQPRVSGCTRRPPVRASQDTPGGRGVCTRRSMQKETSPIKR